MNAIHESNSTAATTTNQASATLPDLLTKQEVAARLRRTPRCIELWMRKRYLPYIKIGRSVYFRWSDVSAQLDQFRVN
jgi:hypothetical protein